MTNTDKNIMPIKIGLFDSGIGGFSVLGELFKVMPHADYFYLSDDANAPYGPKSDEFITERAIWITEELKRQGVKLIVVACNTATAASIDDLREKFKDMTFVGVEPYLNAYYKMPEDSPLNERKMMVLTTESTGKSERFKRLKDRLDPESMIDHFSLKNLARLIEDFYYKSENEHEFELKVKEELAFLKKAQYSYAILGCTHYPLIRGLIESTLNLQTISPDAHVAKRVADLTQSVDQSEANLNHPSHFLFFSTKINQWIKRNRESLYGPFKGSKYVKN